MLDPRGRTAGSGTTLTGLETVFPGSTMSERSRWTLAQRVILGRSLQGCAFPTEAITYHAQLNISE
jgi:hypothetical protein